MPLTVSQIGEFGLIKKIKKQAGPFKSGVIGIGDDTAVVPFTKGKKLLLTTDALVEDVHFTRRMPARWIGHKALACNISDIAAMGGTPDYALVSIGVSPRTPWTFVKDVYRGITNLAGKFKCSLVGGDTVKCDKIMINIALIGQAKTGEIVSRSGARVGDQIFVSGSLGNSFKSGHHLRFYPKVKEARYLVKHFKPSAMIDCSDGLAADLGHILQDSDAGALIRENDIPRRKNADLNDALYEGEDFELIFTLSRKKADRLQKIKTFRFFHIGEIVAGQDGFHVIDARGRKRTLRHKGYIHF